MARIAVLSTAHIHTRSFLENIAAAHDGRVVHGLWDDVAERGRRYAEQFSVPFVADLDQLVHDPSVDGFLICAENTRHRPLLEKAIPLGKPVFCEKPLATADEDAAALLALLERVPTTLFCGYFQPFLPIMQGVARELAAGTLGKITHAGFVNAHHAAYGHWFDNPDLAWFHDPALSGGGALMDMGTHALHLLCSFFGKPTDAWALTANKAGVYPAVDDFGVAHFRFPDGVFGTVNAAWVQTGGIDGLHVVGSEGAIWNTPSGYVLGRPGQTPEPLVPGEARPDRVDRLVAAIRGDLSEEERSTDTRAVFAAVAGMAAAYRAAESGTWQALR